MLQITDRPPPMKSHSTFQNSTVTLPQSNDVELGDFIHTIVDSWHLILAIFVALISSGVLYIVVVEPIYRADVLLQVEAQPKGIGALAELSGLLQEEAPVSAEFEILKSRLVLGTVVDNLKLSIDARANYFPLMGGLISKLNGENKHLSDSWLGFTRFAWGGEKIKIETFDVPPSYQDKEFTLITETDGRYRLLNPDNDVVLRGAVGESAISVPGVADEIQLFVSELKSHVGTHFKLTRQARLGSIEKLKESLTITELGKQSGILQLSLEGPDRVKIKTILNEVANIYLRQSVERKSAEAEKTLQFLDEQLPVLKDKMESAEVALNNYRLKKGSVDLPLETQATLDKMVTIDAELTQLKKSREDLIRRFTTQHPRVAAIDAQIANMNSDLKSVDVKVKGLPTTQQMILQLTRDAQVSTSLYTSLMNSAQELKVVKAGAVGNVRIVDYAITPHEPVKPNKGLVLALTVLLGVFVGLAIAFLRRTLTAALQDPDLIEKKLGLPVYATIPRSRKQKALDKSKDGTAGLLAVQDPTDLAIESLRSLRTSLHFAKLNASNNVICITSPNPGAGKTFISVNLGIVFADSGQRVLLVDADMRRGRIHSFFNRKRDGGLSELILGDTTFENSMHKTKVSRLDILTAGVVPPNPSELLLHERFYEALVYFSAKYDIVLVDSPPILAVTDAAIIGRLAGATLLVVRDNQSPLREIEEGIKRLQQTGVNLCGAVYNGMTPISSRYGYGRYYGYAYVTKA